MTLTASPLPGAASDGTNVLTDSSATIGGILRLAGGMSLTAADGNGGIIQPEAAANSREIREQVNDLCISKSMSSR
jgi:hypothetical protein